MAGALRVILGDQLTMSLPIISEAVKSRDVLMLAEVREEASYVRHHKKKLILVFSAMRHFAEELKKAGYKVHYRTLDEDSPAATLLDAARDALQQFDISNVFVTRPGEYRLLKSMEQWSHQLNQPVEILPDTRFLCSEDEFAKWAEGKKQLRMEFFYREMRRKYHVLLDDGEPAGGKWNYDAQNREPLPADEKVPSPVTFEPDEITENVIDMVESDFADNFGDSQPFHYAVTREQAREVLKDFISNRLPRFGTYQDAMREGKPWLFHSHLSFYINLGLLEPGEVIEEAERAWRSDEAPLNAAEGFIRQILGWREFVRGFYWYYMPELKNKNYFNATRSLPSFFWDGYTNMNCLRQCITETKQNAYAHHIQRLMVIGNFSLLAELHPEEVQQWYLLVYADAYEWVELPNVSSMILYADGGQLASKPYAASGSYINKMSDYCKNCGYQVSKKTGEKACPFNYLYWRFVEKHREKLENNPRMAMIYKTMARMDENRIDEMKADAATFLHRLSSDEEV